MKRLLLIGRSGCGKTTLTQALRGEKTHYKKTQGLVFEDFVIDRAGYRLVFLSNDTTGFALSASGRDSIQLHDPAGNIISQVKLQTLEADQVVIFKNGVWQLSNQPTPGFANDLEGRYAFQTGEAAE